MLKFCVADRKLDIRRPVNKTVTLEYYNKTFLVSCFARHLKLMVQLSFYWSNNFLLLILTSAIKVARLEGL